MDGEHVGTIMDLKPWHRDILAALDGHGGFLAKSIGEKVWPRLSPRSRSQAARMHLLELERRGYVRKMDAEKPVCWIRTAAGTEAIVNGG